MSEVVQESTKHPAHKRAPSLKYARAYPKSPCDYEPMELMYLWRAVTKGFLPPLNFDRRTPWACRYWRDFVRLRAWLIEEGVQPLRYFRSLVERVQRGREHGKPFKVFANALGGELYATIYREWEDHLDTPGSGTTSDYELEWAIDFQKRRVPAGAQVARAIRESAMVLLFYWTIYERESFAEHLSRAMWDPSGGYSPYLLFFLPEAQPFVQRYGPRTGNQRKIFSRLRTDKKLRERYQEIYDSVMMVNGVPQLKRWLDARDRHVAMLAETKEKYVDGPLRRESEVRLDLVDGRINVQGDAITVAPRRTRAYTSEKSERALWILKQQSSTKRSDFHDTCRAQGISSRTAEAVVTRQMNLGHLDTDAYIGRGKVYQWKRWQGPPSGRSHRDGPTGCKT